jgi:N-acetyl-alpha-D-glucosaminyl L-malate synthase BshA
MKLKIGISCYPTYGGSGVVATELGMKLAERGHEIHFITYDEPQRLKSFMDNIFLHKVEVLAYPLFTYPPYSVALANKIAEVARYAHLDILHAHYAMPHAISAYLAKQMLQPWCLKIITTLHGTDITLVGKDPTFMPITRFSIDQSNALTAVSKWLRMETIKTFRIKKEVDVIYNFIDHQRFKPEPNLDLRQRLAPKGEKLFMHISNFRGVKRTPDLVDIWTIAKRHGDVKLILVGDGPERPKLEQKCRQMGVCDKIAFLGNHSAIEELLPVADVFLLPSRSESFGLAALEAMSCGVPVVCSNAGGLPEVIKHGETGFLFDVGDVGAMAEAAAEIAFDDEKHSRMAKAARLDAVNRFDIDVIVDQYEALYRQMIFSKYP